MGDDGIIYELKGTLTELGSFHGGYGLYEEDGSKAIDSSSIIFFKSQKIQMHKKDTWKYYQNIIEGLIIIIIRKRLFVTATR